MQQNLIYVTIYHHSKHIPFFMQSFLHATKLDLCKYLPTFKTYSFLHATKLDLCKYPSFKTYSILHATKLDLCIYLPSFKTYSVLHALHMIEDVSVQLLHNYILAGIHIYMYFKPMAKINAINCLTWTKNSLNKPSAYSGFFLEMEPAISLKWFLL